jgi:hypothetical protein
MPPTVVENAHNEQLKIKTCWCIQIYKLYHYVYQGIMAFYRSSRDKLTLGAINNAYKSFVIL